MSEKFKVGEYVIYSSINGYELGQIKSIKGTMAFVYYHGGETAACTSLDLLHKIVNGYVISDTTLGGQR